MYDPRVDRLAEILLFHSCQLDSGQKVLIEAFDLPDPALLIALVRKAAPRGVWPYVVCKHNAVLRTLFCHASEEAIGFCGQLERQWMEQMDAYIGIRGAANSSEFCDVPGQRMQWYQKHWWEKVHLQVRVPRTRWVVLRWPTPSMAQEAQMSTEAFEDFFFEVCTVDYEAMGRALEPLAQLMEKTDRVRITGPDTHLEFSIRGVPVRPCFGQRNIPDGEIFTAPVRESVQGRIRFNAATRYQGVVFEDICLEFEGGRVVRASCRTNQQRLEQILDSDPGARFVGEFALGCNNRIRRPMLDILFDEKIGGSLHLALGNAYEEADNGNRSQVHWDLVLLQRPEFGGGEVWFDDRLVRKDGRFVLPELEGLNQGLQ